MSNTSALKLFRVVLPVSELDRGVEFYARLCGVPGKRVSPGRHYFDCGGVTLCIYDPLCDGDPAPVGPLATPIYFEVDNLEDAYERALALGPVESVEPMAKRPWGEESFYMRDPFGNPLCFVKTGTTFSGQFFVD